MVKKFSPSFQGAFHPSTLDENEELSAGMKTMVMMMMMIVMIMLMIIMIFISLELQHSSGLQKLFSIYSI
jgi:uncharacterized membrane protein